MKEILIGLIRIYKRTLSPMLYGLGVRCRHYPSCSDYSINVIKEKGVLAGAPRALIRFLKCNPLFEGDVR